MTSFYCRFCGRVYDQDEVSVPMKMPGWIWVKDECPGCHKGMDDWYVSTTRIGVHNRSTRGAARAAWANAKDVEVPPRLTRNHVMEMTVSKDPYNVEIIEWQGETKIRMYAWCHVDMDVGEARGLIRLLEAAIGEIENGGGAVECSE